MFDQRLHFPALELQIFFAFGITPRVAQHIIELGHDIIGRTRNLIDLRFVPTSQNHFLVHHQIGKRLSFGFAQAFQAPVDLGPRTAPILIDGRSARTATHASNRFELHHDPDELPDHKSKFCALGRCRGLFLWFGHSGVSSRSRPFRGPHSAQ